MKETIAFPQLVEQLAEKASTTERMSELFLQELFAVVTQELADGKTMTIKGLGTFKATKDETGKDIIFTPDKDLAEAVNAPFAQFEPIELCDEVTDEMLSEIDAQYTLHHVECGMQDASQEDKNTRDQEDKNTREQEDNQSVGRQVPLGETLKTKEQEDNPPLSTRNYPLSTRTWLIAAAIAATLIAVWYFYTHRSKERIDKAVETTQVTPKDKSANAKDAKPQPIVTDTIGNGNVLFTMAKKHYGDQAFWVYIARENQAQYPDYRKIPTGAILVIPPAEKYGINSDSKQSLKNANAEAWKLYKEVKAAEENEASKDNDVIADDKSKSQAVSPVKKPAKKPYSKNYHHKKYQKRRHYR